MTTPVGGDSGRDGGDDDDGHARDDGGRVGDHVAGSDVAEQPVSESNGGASHLPSRRNPYSVPWNCWPPLRVVEVISTPAFRPNSALNAEFWSLNSPTASRLNWVYWPSFAPVSVLGVPSSITLFML